MSVIVNGLTKRYGQQKAVNEISFAVEKGQIMGFLGPNGAGKSTTMKMLTGYIDPTAGEASVCGKSIYNDAVALRRHIGYLPEHNPLYLEMYVREYLEFSGKMYGLGKNLTAKVDNMIELTGLGLERKKKLRQLSKGYRQRAGLAQALLHDPEVLILDEPTSGLDPNQILEIRKLIIETGKEKTVILSTHIMQEVQALCDRVMILNQGNIVADETTENLMNRFSGRETLSVQFKNKMPKEALKKLKGILEIEEKDHNLFVVSTKGGDPREQVFQIAVDTKNPILYMNKSVESLEAIFQQLTKASA